MARAFYVKIRESLQFKAYQYDESEPPGLRVWVEARYFEFILNAEQKQASKAKRWAELGVPHTHMRRSAKSASWFQQRPSGSGDLPPQQPSLPEMCITTAALFRLTVASMQGHRARSKEPLFSMLYWECLNNWVLERVCRVVRKAPPCRTRIKKLLKHCQTW